ncbi:MAG: FHA domain-containing protein, partial [Candidatus Polarisedimenticolia bacterium]
VAAAAPARPAAPAKPRAARLTVEGNAVVFPLSGGEMLVGRYDPVTETQPEIDLGALDTKRSVSRRHARLFERDGVWHVVEEGGALNGTFVNGVKLQQGRPAPLSDGDTVSLGMVRLVFRES